MTVAGSQLEHFRSPDRALRDRAALVGLLRYARSRLSAAAYRRVTAWAAYHEIPLDPDVFVGVGNRTLLLEALETLIKGYQEAVNDDTLPTLSTSMGGTSDADSIDVANDVRVSADLIITGDLTLGGNLSASELAPQKIELSGDLVVPSSGLAVGAVVQPVTRGEVRIETRMEAESFRLTQSFGRPAFFRDNPDDMALFETLNGRLGWVKVNSAAVSGDEYNDAAAPAFDTGWHDIHGILRGDVGASPPYEQGYPLNVQLSTAVPGARKGAVDVQVFFRSPIVPDQPEQQNYILSGGVTSGLYGYPMGVDVLLQDDGDIVLRVAPFPRWDGQWVYTQVRVMIWYRGVSV